VGLCRQRIELSRELGDVRGEALSLGVLADAYQVQGRYDLAAQSLVLALQSFRAHGADRHHGLSLMKLGHAYEAMGAFPDAIRCLEESLPIFRQLQLPHKVEQAREALDRCRCAVAMKREAGR
jgi:tetratricopeptide (TPR) repeat protein